MRIFLAVLFIFATPFAIAQEITPTKKYNISIDFSDDLDFDNIDLAIERQMKSFTASRMKGTIKFGQETYPKTIIRDSLVSFQALVNKYRECAKVSHTQSCMSELNKALNSDFTFYRPTPKREEQGFKTGESLFTAYYSPDLTGSYTQDETFKHAIYAMPTDPELKKLSRVEIDFDKKLAGHGLELFYVSESLYDIWLLHVEGGGRVKVKDANGKIHYYYLSYAGANGQSFRMVYRYLLDNGHLEAGKASIAEQRAFLESNPHLQREVFASTPSYIFFKVTEDEPVGVNNIPLTEKRSIATDYRIYKDYGLLHFVQTKKPTRLENGSVEQQKFARFFISQDTGGAIRGNSTLR